MKRIIITIGILLLCGSAWAEEGVVTRLPSYDGLISIGQYCPYRHKVVPESEANEWYNRGWEPIGVMGRKGMKREVRSGNSFYVTHEVVGVYILLRKRVCDEGGT